MFAERGEATGADRARTGRGPRHRAALRREGRRGQRFSAREVLGRRRRARSRRRARPSDRLPARGARRAPARRCRSPRGARRARVRRAGARRRVDPGERSRSTSPLAPLHQPHNLAPIRAMLERSPRAAAGGVLRHRVPPRRAAGGAGVRAAEGDHRPRRAPLRLPRPLVRVHRSGAAAIRRARGTGQTVVLHLGNGASMCAIADGRSVASTMGFTAADGLPMGTRCGSLDPGVMLYLLDELEMDARAVEKLIYQQSGLLGMSGVSSDMRTLRGQRRAAAPRTRSTSSSTGSAASWVRSRQRWAGWTRSCSPPASARTAVRCARASAGTPRGWVSNWTQRPTNARRPADQHRGEPGRRLGDPDRRGTDDRAPRPQPDRPTLTRPPMPVAAGTARAVQL